LPAIVNLLYRACCAMTTGHAPPMALALLSSLLSVKYSSVCINPRRQEFSAPVKILLSTSPVGKLANCLMLGGKGGGAFLRIPNPYARTSSKS
jgi:hypothetical protein